MDLYRQKEAWYVEQQYKVKQNVMAKMFVVMIMF